MNVTTQTYNGYLFSEDYSKIEKNRKTEEPVSTSSEVCCNQWGLWRKNQILISVAWTVAMLLPWQQGFTGVSSELLFTRISISVLTKP